MHTYKADAIASLGRLQEKLETTSKDIAGETQFQAKASSYHDADTSSDNVQRSLSDAAKEIRNLLDKFGSNSGGSTNWKDYDIFSGYSTAELGAIAHIISSVFILNILFNVFFIVYGDALIIYLDLENRYPSFAKFIRLRRKLHKYYLGFGLFMACAVLFFMIYVDLLVLI